MALRSILQYPDSRLRAPANPVRFFDEPLLALAGDLLDTLRGVRGIGITAPHIGVLSRLVIIELPGVAKPSFYANPSIVSRSLKIVRHEEGSVSMPGVVDIVERAADVRVRYQDTAGKAQEVEAEGFLAICLQHEIDQLDGIFWIQRLSRLRRDRLVRHHEKHRPRKLDK